MGINDIAIFASNYKRTKKYNYINQFINIEELREPTNNIIDNFKLLLLKNNKNLTNNNNLIIKLEANNISEITSQSIKIPKLLKTKILQSEFHLFDLVSSKIKIKILIKIGIRLKKYINSNRNITLILLKLKNNMSINDKRQI